MCECGYNIIFFLNVSAFSFGSVEFYGTYIISLNVPYEMKYG